MVNFNKVSSEQAKEIINALKDGKINDKEAKDLKLTPQEQAALNEAFSSGEVQIGDFILVNKGKSKDGKMQYSQTKKAPTQIPEEEPSFLDKAWNKIKKDVGQYANNFKTAWNKSNGFIETTGALVGATTKTATDMIKNTANNTQKGVTELTGSEAAGNVARYATTGLAADIAEGVEKAGDWSADKIRDVAKQYSGSERALLESFAEIVDDMNAVDIALLFVGGTGAVKCAKDLPKILKLLTAGGATMALASCAPGDEDIIQEVNITVSQNSSLAEAIAALKEGQDVTNRILQQILEREIQNGATAEEILKMVGGNQKILVQIVESLAQNNSLLNDIKNEMGANNEKVLNTMLAIKNSIDNLTQIASKFPDIKQQLDQVIALIKDGNADVATLKATVENIFTQLQKNGEVQESILAKLDEIENSNMSESEKTAAMLELLKEIKSTIDGITGDLKEHFKNDATVNGYLEKILAEVKKNNAKTDETNALLKKLYALVETLGKDGDKLGKEILNYIATVGFDMNTNFSAILDAINTGNKGTEELKSLLEKVLEKQDQNMDKIDANGKAIIEAMGNIKIDGENVDLSSIEKMMAELLAQAKENGNILSSIDGKTDVLNVTTKAILAKLEDEFGKNDDRYTNIMNMLNAIKNNTSGSGDDAKLLDKLDKILAKLDEILAAIKDHKVQVDVTGKVTCECNCGKNHEGIIGDLNDILG